MYVKKLKNSIFEGVCLLGVSIPFDNPLLSATCTLTAEINVLKKLINYEEYLNNYAGAYINSIEYQDVYKNYMLLLKELSAMFQKLGAHNEMEQFSIYNYLFRRGYLSIDHKFYYSKLSQSALGFYGLNILSGAGDCKHINSMLTDLLNLDGRSAYNVAMKLDGPIATFGDADIACLSDNDNKITTPSTDQSDDFLFNLIYRLVSVFHKYNMNHLASLFVDDDHSYIMDACNNTVFGIFGQKAFQDEYTTKIDYNSFANQYEKRKISKLLKDSCSTKTDKLITDYYRVLDMYRECNDIFERFYLEHKDLYGDIVDKRKILINECEKYHIFRRDKK